MKVRLFQPDDTPVLITLFRDTVRRVCSADYDNQQLLAWAPDDIDANAWTTRFLDSLTLVAEEGDLILGFANLEGNGNVDMFYVHAERQSKGVGKILFTALEDEAKKLEMKSLNSDVSITARPFFLKMGFSIKKEYLKLFQGCPFKNALMSKLL